ncbi:MAG: PAS domain S-box protein [Syntrophales bacterium]|nr:PAS domain S-box protein [Syntrophales bacterium]
MIRITIIFAAAYWFIESAIDALLFNRGTLLEMIFTADPYEYFVRLTGAGFIVTIGMLAQYMLKRIQGSEEQLRRFRHQNELILESAGEGILGIDQEGKITFINPAAAAMSGFTPAELAGQSFHDLLHYSYPDGSPLPLEDCPVFNSLREGKIQRQSHDVFWTKEGKSIWVEYSITPIIENRKITGAVVVFTDISARKQAEEELLRHREHLENLVAARTGELTRTNEQMREEIEERTRAEKALVESEKKLRFLTKQLMNVQERERSRISAELHDELGQALMVLKMDVSSLQDKLRKEQDPLRKECSRLLSEIDHIIENVRRLCWDLGPYLMEGLGLTASLQSLIEETCKKHNLICTMKLDEIDQIFPPEIKTNIYRILQESLTNIVKHATASQVSGTISIERENLIMEVVDDGQGFQVEELLARPGPDGGLGLTAMQERARQIGGELSISSQAGQGTVIKLTLPLPSGPGPGESLSKSVNPQP